MINVTGRYLIFVQCTIIIMIILAFKLGKLGNIYKVDYKRSYEIPHQCQSSEYNMSACHCTLFTLE